MAKLFNGMINFASAIKPTGAQPLDDRTVVKSFNDLLADDTFGLAKYNGMIVSVVDDGKLYMLQDSTNSSSEDSWLEIGSDAVGAQEATNYTAALSLITSEELPLGTLIKVANEEGITTGEGESTETKTYNAGFYIVSGTGEAASLLYLSTSSGTDVTIDTVVTDVENIKTDVNTVKADVDAVEEDVIELNTTVSGLTEDVSKIEETLNGSEQVNGLVERVETLEAVGAQANVIEKVQVNGADLTITNKTVNVVVPETDLSDYSTTTEVETLISNAVSGKADATSVYTKNEADEKFLLKTDAYDDTDVRNLISGETSARETAVSGLTTRVESLEALDNVTDVKYVTEEVEGETKRTIYLVDSAGNKIGEGFDASAFIKDGMINTVTYNSSNQTITISFNTDAGKDDITITLTDLVNIYTAGEGLKLDGSEFSVDFDVVAKKDVLDTLSLLVGTREEGDTDDVFTKLATLASDKADKTALDELSELVGTKANSGDVYTKTETNELLSDKADNSALEALSSLVGKEASDEAAASGIFAELAALAEKNGKQDSAIETLENLTVNGVGIDNGTITLDSADIKLNAAFGKKEVDGTEVDRYTTGSTIQYALVDIDTRIDAINTTIDNVTGGVIADITAGDGINVDKTTKTNPTISANVDNSSIEIDSNKKIAVKLSTATDNVLVVDENGGLLVQAITIDGNDIEQ